MVPLGKYKHYKGGEYEVIANGLDEATELPVVIYKTLYHNPKSEIWVRTETDFTQLVEHEGKQVPRFSKVSYE